jgi:energy-coupling factor transporter ATP-binding protein EcfA2
MSSLSVTELQFQYLSSQEPQADGLTLHVEPGATCLILGDNGSGKTTLGKLLTGLLEPQSGSVLVNGERIHDIPAAVRPRYAVYMGQTSYLQFFRTSIAEEIAFALDLAGSSPEQVELAYRAFHLPADRTRKPMDLAYSEMWRLQLLLLGVVFAPAVLFVDEIVAPSSWFQRDALDYVLQSRTRAGQITLIAYQRALGWLRPRTYALERGKLNPA